MKRPFRIKLPVRSDGAGHSDPLQIEARLEDRGEEVGGPYWRGQSIRTDRERLRDLFRNSVRRFRDFCSVPLSRFHGTKRILMPISSRRQLNELPDDLAAKITVHYYLDARDALLKALAIRG